MTTPELLAAIDETVAAYEAWDLNRRDQQRKAILLGRFNRQTNGRTRSPKQGK